MSGIGTNTVCENHGKFACLECRTHYRGQHSPHWQAAMEWDELCDAMQVPTERRNIFRASLDTLIEHRARDIISDHEHCYHEGS